MDRDFVLLTEKESMWAEMLMQVLKDNGILCVSKPVLGAGFTLRTGTSERLQVYVPNEIKEKANELMRSLFSEA